MSHTPVTSITEAIARMEAIEAVVPAGDGLGCYNGMYLAEARQVESLLSGGGFADPLFMSELDITLANLYFKAVDAAADPPTVPLAWRPLVEQRSQPGIEPIQFALAGMNVHISHDLPLAVVCTCTALDTSPAAVTHLADRQKMNWLLPSLTQSVRWPFGDETRQLRSIPNLIASWSINSALDIAWTNSLLLWEVREIPAARELLGNSLAATAAQASHMLLAAI